jgi:tungstate transport system substrate-binding protein
METRTAGVWLIIILLIASISVSGTSYYFGVGPFASGRTKLAVATTTSLYDTGLLDVIEDLFEGKHPIDVYFISAGTGVAIKHAQNGDADMLLVHAPPREFAFLEGGYGAQRKIIAYNFFSIVGPIDDPAGVNNLSLSEALTRIVEAGRRGEATWISREDESGTHTKEKTLWSAAGYDWNEVREEDWYLECGCGMGTALRIADEKFAYTLSDLGTYLKYYTDRLISLVVAVDEDKELLNVYSAIVVNKDYNPEVNFDAAVTFLKFLVSEEGQQIIDEYGEKVYPEKLFYPAVELLMNETDETLVDWIKDFAFFDGQECPEEYRDDHNELYG